MGGGRTSGTGPAGDATVDLKEPTQVRTGPPMEEAKIY